MANIILHEFTNKTEGLSMRKPNTEPRQDAILPAISPPCTARVLVHRYVTSISRGAHTVDLFDDHNRCLVSHTRYIHTSICTNYQVGGCTSGQIYRFEDSQHRQPLMHTTQMVLVLVHTERLSRLTPATMGALRYLPTSPNP